VSGDLAPAHLC